MHPGLAAMVEHGRGVSAAELIAALDDCHRINAELVGLFHDVRLLVTPTTAAPPPPLALAATGLINGQPDANWVRFTYPFNMTRSPAATVCAGSHRRRAARSESSSSVRPTATSSSSARPPPSKRRSGSTSWHHLDDDRRPRGRHGRALSWRWSASKPAGRRIDRGRGVALGSSASSMGRSSPWWSPVGPW